MRLTNHYVDLPQFVTSLGSTSLRLLLELFYLCEYYIRCPKPTNLTTIIPTHRNNRVLLYYSVIQNLPKHGQVIFGVWFLVLPGPFHLSFSMRCPITFHARH